LADIQAQDDIKTVVDSFYAKVVKDPLLAPIFEKEIHSWDAHLPRMYSFWGTLLIGEMSYRGSPYSFHAHLPIDKSHFDQWVALFCEAVDEHFSGPVADQAKNFAKTNGHIFESKMRMSK